MRAWCAFALNHSATGRKGLSRTESWPVQPSAIQTPRSRREADVSGHGGAVGAAASLFPPRLATHRQSHRSDPGPSAPLNRHPAPPLMVTIRGRDSSAHTRRPRALCGPERGCAPRAPSSCSSKATCPSSSRAGDQRWVVMGVRGVGVTCRAAVPAPEVWARGAREGGGVMGHQQRPSFSNSRAVCRLAAAATQGTLAKHPGGVAACWEAPCAARSVPPPPGPARPPLLPTCLGVHPAAAQADHIGSSQGSVGCAAARLKHAGAPPPCQRRRHPGGPA
jgi:hypothetical protein